MRCVCSKRMLAQARKKYGKPQYPGKTVAKSVECEGLRKRAESVSEIWVKVLKGVEEEINPIAYETWVKPCRLLKLEENKVVLAAENELYIEVLKKRFLHLLKAEFQKVIARDMKIEFVVSAE